MGNFNLEQFRVRRKLPAGQGMVEKTFVQWLAGMAEYLRPPPGFASSACSQHPLKSRGETSADLCSEAMPLDLGVVRFYDLERSDYVAVFISIDSLTVKLMQMTVY